MGNLDCLTEMWSTWRMLGVAGLVNRYDDFFTEDAEWRPPMRELTAPRYVGREGLERYGHDLESVLAELHGDLEEVTELAGDVVRVTLRIRTAGRISGVTADAPMTILARFRDGRVVTAWASYDRKLAQQAEDVMVRGEAVPT